MNVHNIWGQTVKLSNEKLRQRRQNDARTAHYYPGNADGDCDAFWWYRVSDVAVCKHIAFCAGRCEPRASALLLWERCIPLAHASIDS